MNRHRGPELTTDHVMVAAADSLEKESLLAKETDQFFTGRPRDLDHVSAGQLPFDLAQAQRLNQPR